jgi:hypothetical protein
VRRPGRHDAAFVRLACIVLSMPLAQDVGQANHGCHEKDGEEKVDS